MVKQITIKLIPSHCSVQFSKNTEQYTEKCATQVIFQPVFDIVCHILCASGAFAPPRTPPGLCPGPSGGAYSTPDPQLYAAMTFDHLQIASIFPTENTWKKILNLFKIYLKIYWNLLEFAYKNTVDTLNMESIIGNYQWSLTLDASLNGGITNEK